MAFLISDALRSRATIGDLVSIALVFVTMVTATLSYYLVLYTGSLFLQSTRAEAITDGFQRKSLRPIVIAEAINCSPIEEGDSFPISVRGVVLETPTCGERLNDFNVNQAFAELRVAPHDPFNWGASPDSVVRFEILLKNIGNGPAVDATGTVVLRRIESEGDKPSSSADCYGATTSFRVLGLAPTETSTLRVGINLPGEAFVQDTPLLSIAVTYSDVYGAKGIAEIAHELKTFDVTNDGQEISFGVRIGPPILLYAMPPDAGGDKMAETDLGAKYRSQSHRLS